MDSGTGPDAVATRILKNCADTLGLPIAILARKSVDEEHWPSIWKAHWILPLYKKRSVFDASNYRGVHLTSQVAKVIERLLDIHLSKFSNNPMLLVLINLHTGKVMDIRMLWP